MKKLLSLALTASLCLFLLTACGAKNAPSKDDVQPATSSPVENSASGTDLVGYYDGV